MIRQDFAKFWTHCPILGLLWRHTIKGQILTYTPFKSLETQLSYDIKTLFLNCYLFAKLCTWKNMTLPPPLAVLTSKQMKIFQIFGFCHGIFHELLTSTDEKSCHLLHTNVLEIWSRLQWTPLYQPGPQNPSIMVRLHQIHPPGPIYCWAHLDAVFKNIVLSLSMYSSPVVPSLWPQIQLICTGWVKCWCFMPDSCLSGPWKNLTALGEKTCQFPGKFGNSRDFLVIFGVLTSQSPREKAWRDFFSDLWFKILF